MTTELGALRSDRLVRLALLAILAILGVALVIERTHTDCFPATMSQYVNTALRPAVTAGFAAIGICLVLVRPTVRSHERVSTAAGAMAIVVAIAPARARDAGCTSIPLSELAVFNTSGAQTTAAVLIVAVVSATVLGSGAMRPLLVRRLVWALALIVLPAVVASMIVHVLARSQAAEIVTQVHNVAAAGLFMALIAHTHQTATAATSYYRRGYRSCTIALVFLCVGAAIADLADERFISGGWEHPILVAQMIGFAVLGAFWALQVAEQR